MPSTTQHKLQFQHNLDFLSTFYPNTPYLDWATTVYFYTAVHLIEAVFASLGIHCGNHSQRHGEVNSRLPTIAKHYMRLYNASRSSRYQIWRPSEKYVRTLISGHFNPLRNFLLRKI